MATLSRQLTYQLFLMLVHHPTLVSSQELNCDKLADSDVKVADTCTVELVDENPSVWQFVERLRFEYEDYPAECEHRRLGKDMCNETKSTGSQRKGDIKWPTTLVGSRRAVRCQYAYTDAAYVSRDCVADVSSPSETWAVWNKWNDSNIDAQCPEPPFTLATQTLYESLVNVTSLAESGLCESVAGSMMNLTSIRIRYPRDPLFDTDHQQLMTVSVRWMAGCHVSERAANSSWRQLKVKALLAVTDLVLFNSSFRRQWKPDSYATYIESMMRVLQSLTAAASVNRSEQLQYLGNTFSVLAESTVASNSRDSQYIIESSDSLGTIIVNASDLSLASIHIILLQNIHFLVANFRQKQQQPLPTTNQGNSSSVVSRLRRLDSSHTNATHDMPTISIADDVVTRSNRQVQHTQMKRVVGSVALVACIPRYGNNTIHEETDRHELSMTIIFKHSSYRKLILDDIVCASKPTKKNSSTTSTNWYGASCHVLFLLNDSVGCRCSQTTGYFTVLTDFNSNEDNEVPGTHVYRTTQKPISDLSTFMGFPYNFELYVTGQVLRTVSMVCLVATVATYVFCNNIRCGTPGRILINLCISLIALNIVLYIAEQCGGSKFGCRISNILRYYFIIVSLLWNGIEAHNMYRMLVQVFSLSSKSLFVLKAAVVAWVFPAIVVAIILASHYKVFDGTYHQCEFRCSLKPNTLYYGWLLPMSAIILHNFVVFSMVLKVLCQRKHPGNVPKNNTGNTQDSLRSHWTRLCGACAMLVLLGVPWIFSAFAIIDSSNTNKQLQNVEGLFNIVFVVGVNLQGMFIFGFHCARLPAVRESWKTSIVSRFSSNSGSTFNTSSAAAQPLSTTVPRAVKAINSNIAIGTETRL